jgi:hypothetical protein
MKVLLIPKLGLTEDPSHDSASIGFNFSPLDWIRWFESYRLMLRHYANLATLLDVDTLAVGWQLSNSSSIHLFVEEII